MLPSKRVQLVTGALFSERDVGIVFCVTGHRNSSCSVLPLGSGMIIFT
jgi:hypothetical protein